jgi:hypothetical protein
MYSRTYVRSVNSDNKKAIMKTFKKYILRPFLIIILWALIFSFIAGTIDFREWNIWLRFMSVIVLFYTFVVTDND